MCMLLGLKSLCGGVGAPSQEQACLQLGTGFCVKSEQSFVSIQRENIELGLKS